MGPGWTRRGTLPPAEAPAALAAGQDATALTASQAVHAHLAACLATMNAGAGSSRRVERLLLLTGPPRLGAGEITDKGYVNQRATLTRRAGLVAALYTGQGHPCLVAPEKA